MQSDGSNSGLSPVVYGDIELSINTQYNILTKSVCFLDHLFLEVHEKNIYKKENGNKVMINRFGL